MFQNVFYVWTFKIVIRMTGIINSGAEECLHIPRSRFCRRSASKTGYWYIRIGIIKRKINYAWQMRTWRSTLLIILKNISRNIRIRPIFSVGIEDNSSFCNCERCKASHEKYGGASGTYIRFVNRVAQEINVWQKKELPDSRFKLVVFAYLWTKNPPVRYGEGGKYTLLENTANFRIIGNGVIKRRSFVPRILRRIRSDVGR